MGPHSDRPRGRARGAAAVGLALGLAGVLGGPAPAPAQTGCAATGPALGTVSIDRPAAGERVSGTVTVAGAARLSGVAPGELRGVTVEVDGVAVGSVSGGARDLPYSVSWDTRGVAPGSHTITVQACGSVPGAWGQASRSVEVVRAPAPTTTAAPTTTRAVAPAPPAAEAAPTTTSRPAPTTTTAPAPTTTGRATTTTARPTTTTSAPEPAFELQALGRDDRPHPVAPSVIRPKPARREPAPVYPAVVAGLAGLSGLVWSLAPARRRLRHSAREE
ncbi:MAG TPA: Ig-like domain-containing protein [Acidimicrobiales bacterium]|nr:Ig-like domain-containing protein [Acidimicrobiales bacterium]